jgi:hypothetical protein
MNKPQIIEELDSIIYILESSENTLLANKLKRIKVVLIDDWDLNDFYMDLLRKELNYIDNKI